jgi:thioesterase domain-containing protein/acyl carrier protein
VIILLSTFTYSATWLVTIRGLFFGTTLVFYDLKEDGFSNLPDTIVEQKVTVFRATPTVFRSFVNSLGPGARFPSVQHAIVGGEKTTPHDLLAIHRHFPNVEYININFSSTETHRVSQSRLYLDQDLENVLITAGKPCDDLTVFIWDENGDPIPPGEEGEIVVYSDTLVQGYINNPILTSQRFLPDPQNPSCRYYRTGDLGKILPDGHLLHLGRVDNMVKVKGVRIELTSIENHALSHPGIIQVATRVIDDGRGNRRIVLYFVTESGIIIPVSDLRKHLGERLPAHQLPHYYINLESLPLTPTGKVAIRQLPLPDFTRPVLPYSFEPPANQLERDLQRVWEDQLGIIGVGVCDDFFDLGGDSLLGVVLMVAIEETTGKSLPVSVLLQAPTIRQQADLIRALETDKAFSTLIPIHNEGSLPPLFFIPGKGGYPTRIRHLVKALDPDVPVYALQDLTGYNSPTPGTRQIRSIGSLYLNEIKNVAPRGPYILVGESMGGKICYEMAQQLTGQNEAQPLLFMLDTYNYGGSEAENLGKLSKIQYLKMLSKKHLNIWTKSDWKGKLEYLHFYRETLVNKVGRLIRSKVKRDHPTRPPGSSVYDQIRKNEIRLEEASHNYAAEPYPGEVILVKAIRDPRATSKANGWERINIGKLVIHELDCYHGSILFEPAVSQLAALIQRYVSEMFANRK